MSEEPGRDDEAEAELFAGEEVLDGVPVLVEVNELEAPPTATLPAVQAAAVAAGGFFAGALTMALLKRYAARRLGEAVAAPMTDPPLAWPVGASRTYLVNVRLVGRASTD